MSKRINIVLPENTICTIDRLVRPRERSRFIDRAVQHFVATQSQEALRMRLEQAVVRDRDLDREVAADWFAADKQTWQELDAPKRTPKATRAGAKSTSQRSTPR